MSKGRGAGMGTTSIDKLGIGKELSESVMLMVALLL